MESRRQQIKKNAMDRVKIFTIAAAVTVLLTHSSCSPDPATGLDGKANALEMVRAEMKRCPDGTWLDGMQGKLKWNYTTGLELMSFLEVWNAYGRSEEVQDIYDYVKDWYDEAIDSTGVIYKYRISNYNTDHVCPGNALFVLAEQSPDPRYRMAMETLRSQLKTHPRTSEGGFWHKQTYPHQMWLDGLYMAQPFYAHYTAVYGDPENRDSVYRDIINHFLVVARHTYDPATKLYRHAWDESKQMFWSDKTTGQSQHSWGRALGWYVMGIVDALDYIPENTEGRDSLISILRGIYEVLPEYSDPETGLWYQVLDCPGKEGNYLEATCSAMFSYALLKGIRMGYLDPSLKDYARTTYGNFVDHFIYKDDNGLVSIKDCCEVAGLGGKENRSGDYEYYINEKRRSNDPKGIGPYIMASLEYDRLFNE